MAFMNRPVFLALLLAANVAAVTDAGAFSKLGREDGSLPTEDGVVTAPLPPLQGAGDGPATTAQGAGAPTPVQDPPSAAGAPATPPAAPAQGTTPPAPPAATGTPETAPPAEPQDGAAAGDAEEGTDPAVSQQAMPEQPSGPPPDVIYGDRELPTPVRDLRAKLIEIAKTGEIEKLRPYIETGEDGTVLSFGGVEGDPIEYLKTSSGDGDGVETLAILLEVLEAGHTRNEAGTENEIYVWPYFAGLSIEKLTKPQQVELFELVTAGDYQEMKGFGAYNFYRIGISPDGKLQFFVAGD